MLLKKRWRSQWETRMGTVDWIIVICAQKLKRLVVNHKTMAVMEADQDDEPIPTSNVRKTLTVTQRIVARSHLAKLTEDIP
jgi:hypothetical protein